jgi:hypothetical protein
LRIWVRIPNLGGIKAVLSQKGTIPMGTPVRQYSASIDSQMLEHLKYTGIGAENLADLVVLFVSLKNKYGLVPFAMVAESNPVPNAVMARYMVDSITVNKIVNVLLETPRLQRVSISPHGIGKTTHYELAVTLGG